MRTFRLALTVLASLSPGAGAQTVHLPPVDVGALTHEHTHTSGSPPFSDTVDSVHFPCGVGACNGPGFTASIGTGDTIVVRFEAPPGTRFAVTRAPAGQQTFFANANWTTGNNESTSSFPTAAIAFENLVGVPPTLASSLNYVSDFAQIIRSYNLWTVGGDFSFTALEVQFTVLHPLLDVPRNYGPVTSTVQRSFGSWHQYFGLTPDSTVMAIEPVPGTSFCFGDGTGPPCPCGNSGSPGRGCQNSSTTGGALLDASGTTSPDTMVLNASGEKPTALTIFLQGSQAIGPVVYGDGLRCVHGVLKRLYTKTASAGAVSAPQVGDLSITARSAQMSHPIAPGSTRYYMTYYRDGESGFCPIPTGSTFNGSNAWTILW